jgi:steroid 5-alpha reductase family enzyme
MGGVLDGGCCIGNLLYTEPMKKLFPWLFLGYIAVCVYTLARYQIFASVISRMVLCWLAALLVMTLLFFVGRRLKRIDVVDVGWGLSCIAIAVTGFFLQDGHELRWDAQALTTLLVVLWGGRLSWHIARRISLTDHEDKRYVELRKKWRGNISVHTFLRVFLLQSFLALVVCIPVVHINLEQDPRWSPWIFAGLTVWLTGFVIEIIADKQLAGFTRKPENAGKLIRSGLWRYARYPNYFGELIMWWGIALMSLGTPHGWVGVGGAAAITYLILYVSGIPPKEKRLRRRVGWKTYGRETRLLVPLPKRKD